MSESNKQFLHAVICGVLFWRHTAKKENYSVDQALEALGFTICTLIDGSVDDFNVYKDNIKQQLNPEEYYFGLREAEQELPENRIDDLLAEFDEKETVNNLPTVN
jgi:hypothetical protein